jgi:hypothetical protein
MRKLSGLFHIWSSEGDSPPPVSIEDRSSGLGEQDWVVYWCIWDLWDPANILVLTIAELDDTPLYFTGDIRIVWRSPTDVQRGIAWKTCTRVRWARLDSLIVIVKRGRSCFLRGSRVSSCHVISLVRWLLIRISVTPSNMGEVCSLLSFCRSVISLCSYKIYGYI